MSVVGDVMGALKTVVMLSADVERLGKEITEEKRLRAEQAKEIQSLRERLLVLETTFDVLTRRQLSRSTRENDQRQLGSDGSAQD
jgi:hypothetical protein